MAAPLPGNSIASALPNVLPVQAPRKSHLLAAYKMDEQANSSQAVDLNLDNHGNFNERCSEPEEALRSASQREEDGPAVAGLVTLPKELQLLIAT